MEIRILIRTTEPLTGTAMTGGEKSLDFQGWLELLNTLSTLVGTRKSDSPRAPAREIGGSDDDADSSRVEDRALKE